uniref:MHC class I-like antigen recognition-like domain-containing protein n=1 Tax=Amphilophus citrinellus TaxID=61819 RepID=A0A3Q0S642_AMPCI
MCEPCRPISDHTITYRSLLAIYVLLISIMIHSLKYFLTGSSEVPNLPEFVAVGMVDDVQIARYDSDTQKAEPTQAWMIKLTEDDPQHLEGQTALALDQQQWFKATTENLKQLFNQSGGVHTFQLMVGCEWDEETDELNGFGQFGYDGEDFLSFDLKTQTWITSNQQALITKQNWDSDKADTAQWKNFLTQIFPELLKKYLNYGRSSLRTGEFI